MKKLIALTLALVLCLSVMAATAEGYKLVEEGKFIYATSPDFPPFESTDDNDNVIGIEPDIIALICEQLGLTPEPYATDFDGALKAPAAGKADAVVSGVTVREDRKLVFDFSIPYVTIRQGIVRKVGSDVTMDNLKDVVIGVQRATTGEIYAQEDFGEDHVVGYDKYSFAFQALVNGQVDCVLVDDMVGQAYVKRIPGLEMVETTYEPEEFAFGFDKGNTELKEAFDEQLQKLQDDGTIESIILSYNE
ncbi:MAG: amino acid ABC transporter substrate-binding protein [Clostridia bacterium]|nr:amino acid ABC transporter substrate-binding protein [Clostridia bacterium]